MDNISKRIVNLSDSEFLSFLYSERNREEDLNSYQGWNIWAIAGAIITVICTCYAIISNNINSISPLRLVYILSGILGFALCYRPFFIFLQSLFTRERGVDYRKVRYLKDVSPKLYLWFSLFISAVFSAYIPIEEVSSPFNVVSVCWIIAFILVAVAIIYEVLKNNKIVWSVINGTLYGNSKLDSYYSGILSGVFSIVWVQSFKKVNGDLIGTPDFEIAICFATIIALLYLLVKIKLGEKMSSRMDILLDDYLYKGREKESIYLQILIHRMGYGILEACAKEFNVLQNSIRDLNPLHKRIEEVNRMFSNGSLDVNHMLDYFDTIKSASIYMDKCNDQANALYNKLIQFREQVPGIDDAEEYKYLVIITTSLLKQLNVVLREVNDAYKQMQMWLHVYHCEKYGGWCIRECTHRNERKSWAYRLELLWIRFSRHLSRIIKMRTTCEN